MKKFLLTILLTCSFVVMSIKNEPVRPVCKNAGSGRDTDNYYNSSLGMNGILFKM